MADETPERLSPEDAFDLVASEARFDILQSLWELGQTEDVEPPVSFSTLHDATDVRDSGQFNYHLDTLTPRFVRNVDEGYDLTYAGTQVVGAAVSGVYTAADVESVDPMAVGACPECDGTIEAGYGEGHIAIECNACDLTITDMPAPPVLAATYDDEDLPLMFSRRLIANVQEMNAGFCTLCGGGVDGDLDRSFSDEVETDQPRLGLTWTCRACGAEMNGVAGAAVVDHPAVVAFLHDHGVDLAETYLWELDWLFDAHATVTSEDPLRVAITVAYEDDALELVLDENLDVVATERV